MDAPGFAPGTRPCKGRVMLTSPCAHREPIPLWLTGRAPSLLRPRLERRRHSETRAGIEPAHVGFAGRAVVHSGTVPLAGRPRFALGLADLEAAVLLLTLPSYIGDPGRTRTSNLRCRRPAPFLFGYEINW